MGTSLPISPNKTTHTSKTPSTSTTVYVVCSRVMLIAANEDNEVNFWTLSNVCEWLQTLF